MFENQEEGFIKKLLFTYIFKIRFHVKTWNASRRNIPFVYQNEDKDEPVRTEAFLPYWLKLIPARKVGLNGKEGKKEKRKN